MRDRGFDQLPVLAPSGRKLVGLVTLGNVLSRLTHGRASGQSPVSEVMFDFSKISEVVTDPRDLGKGKDAIKPQTRSRTFIEITMDTPLSVLNRFFEWNSAAVVTEKDESGAMKPLAVVTKVDLLTWMLHQSKANKA
jgi:cystathionine beta-synthase